MLGKRSKLSKLGKLKNNIKTLKNNPNTDFRSIVPVVERNSPFSLIHDHIYRDFDRHKYKRNRIMFPINIPIKFRPFFNKKLYREQIRKSRPYVDGKGRPNLAISTGNQLLLSLYNESDYTTQELLEMLYRLVVHPELASVDLSINPLLQNVQKRIYSDIPNIKFEEVCEYFEYLEKLNMLTDELLIRILNNQINKYYKFKDVHPDHCGRLFRFCETKNVYDKLQNPDSRDLLIGQLPRYVRKFSSAVFCDMFEICIDNHIITSYEDYLFDRHFLNSVWKKPLWFGIDGYCRIFKCFIKIDYVNEDLDLIVNDCFSAVRKLMYKCEDVDSMNLMIKTLDELGHNGVPIEHISDLKYYLFERVLFVETRLKQIKTTEFSSLMMDEIEYYKMRVHNKFNL